MHPGPNLNPIDDLGCWTDLSLTAQFTGRVPFQMVVPAGSAVPATNGDVDLTAVGNANYSASAARTASFSVFLQPPQAAVTGQSLLDLSYDVWQDGYGGWAKPVTTDPGILTNIVSGGEKVPRALPTFPPNKGEKRLTFAVHLPADATSMAFRVCLGDPLPPLPPAVTYATVIFTMKVNGQKVWTNTLQTNGWRDQSVDISKWHGQNVVIELSAGTTGYAVFSWAYWTGLTIQ